MQDDREHSGLDPPSTGRGEISPRDALPSVLAGSVEVSRNLLVQTLVLAMVVTMGLRAMPAAPVLAWGAALLATVGFEDFYLRRAASGGLPGRRAAIAPALRFLATALYAVAAWALLSLGGPNERLFALALMACSMVYVLMRYYRSPVLFLAGISPYLVVFFLMGQRFVSTAAAAGDLVGMITPIFPLALFGVLFWSGRAQLAASWNELTQARQAAEERERAATAANQAKSHFLAAMSHEIRTPLNGVLGMAQAMTSEELSAVQRERLRIIRRSGESLLSVLNDLLDLSKIEASALELELADFDLEDLVRGVAAAFQPGANKKGVAFDLEIAPASPGRYRGDSARIRRILYNLSANAVKFTDKGSILLSVDRDEGELVFQVTDTGIGIAPEDQARLFDDFFQADGSDSRRHGGAGLGLAICRELTSLMGGRIGATSMPGEGSVFTLRLPLELVGQGEQAEPAEPALAQAEGPRELRVLAAEDNDVNQLVLKTLLMQAGVVPVLVENGRQALEAWEREAWDLVLMDIQMPEMDGVAATRAIRLREAETGRARTPIIAVTANAMTHQLVEYEAAGMDGVVAKPVDIARLFAAIESALAGGDGAGSGAPHASAV
jgi:signal transduction histidine kinase/CheY-like chemotaxis protein